MSKNVATFDVIIPIYRVNPDWVSEALESLVAQTVGVAYWNAFIVDGTPIDDPLAQPIQEVCQKFCERFPNATYVRQEKDRIGVSGARNQGIALGTAPWIAFLDADDYWYEYHLAFLLEVIEQRLPEGMGTVDSPRESPSVIYTAADTIIPMASLDGEPRPPMEKVIGHYDIAPLIHPCHDYFRLMAFPPITSQVAVIREGLESINGFDDKLCIVEDTDCWMRILQNFGGDLIQCDAVGGFHRLSEFNTTTQGEQTPAQREDFIASGDVIRERHPRPTPQVIIDTAKEVGVEVDERYAAWLSNLTGGVNREQSVLGERVVVTNDINAPWFAPHHIK